MDRVPLLAENFQGFAIGDFPFEPLHGAMGEYHFRPPQSFAGPWHDPIPAMDRSKTWIIAQTRGKVKCMEYAAKPLRGIKKLCVLAAGDEAWDDYTAGARVRNLLADNCAGLIVRYVNSRCYYLLALEGEAIRLYRREHDAICCLAEAPHPHDPDRFFALRIEAQGSLLACFRDDEPLFAVEDDLYPRGRVAFGTLAPAQFTDIRVETTPANRDALSAEKARAHAETARLSVSYPQPALWRVIDFANFGCGRSIRFGHLLGNGQLQMVLAQNQQRIFGDAFAQISCLTAVDLEGRVLWQLGEPNPEHAHLTADVPLQIYDIDGDGLDEVICAWDFQIWILDGRTGAVKHSVPTPLHSGSAKYLNIGSIERYPYDRLNVDAIRVCNLSGKPRASDLLIKDRYKRLYAMDDQLRLLWQYDAPVNPGHFPFTKDINGDGRDEVLVGYDLLDADGRLMWSLPIHSDHTDEIIIGKIDPEREETIVLASGDEGFILADLQGNILARHQTGHAQRISVGNYRPELPGLEIAMTTYWGNQGILSLFDCKGNRLWSCEPSTNGNIITPVNWIGDGQDLILLHGNCALGGMIDGHRRQVVRFPADGHPELCAEAFDITGDCRDEVLLWDTQKMYVYTQDRSYDGDVIAKPDKYPHFNASNYRGEYAYPAFVPNIWKP